MAHDRKPVPTLRGEERTYFAAAAGGRLVFQRCGECGAAIFYPRTVCPNCLSGELRFEDSTGRGVVYSFTVVYRAGAPGFEDEVPYTVAIVELDEGFRVMANIVACPPERVRVGLPVEVVFERRPDDLVVPQFRPREEAARAAAAGSPGEGSR